MILTLELTKDKLEKVFLFYLFIFFIYLGECGVVEQLAKQNLHSIYSILEVLCVCIT